MSKNKSREELSKKLNPIVNRAEFDGILSTLLSEKPSTLKKVKVSKIKPAKLFPART
jgi:hypothetical protein